MADFESPEVPIWVRQSVHPAPLGRSALHVPSTGRQIRVIEIVPMQLITNALELSRPSRDGAVVADPARDLAKIAVIERHHATGQVGLGFVRGFGLQRGAFATTVAHDAHNIVCVGVSDEDMALCVAPPGRDRRRHRGDRGPADPRRAPTAGRGPDERPRRPSEVVAGASTCWCTSWARWASTSPRRS